MPIDNDDVGFKGGIVQKRMIQMQKRWILFAITIMKKIWQIDFFPSADRLFCAANRMVKFWSASVMIGEKCITQVIDRVRGESRFLRMKQ